MFRLHAERSGTGTGRIYTVTYTATDGANNTTSASATVTVPYELDKSTAADDIMPAQYSLDQNYPNPFNPGTVIRFDIPTASVVTVRVFDMLGREVSSLVNARHHEAGRYEVPFDGSRIGSGVYSYSISAVSSTTGEEFFAMKQMVLMK